MTAIGQTENEMRAVSEYVEGSIEELEEAYDTLIRLLGKNLQFSKYYLPILKLDARQLNRLKVSTEKEGLAIDTSQAAILSNLSSNVEQIEKIFKDVIIRLENDEKKEPEPQLIIKR